MCVFERGERKREEREREFFSGCSCEEISKLESQFTFPYFVSNRGKTGRIEFPYNESCVTKNPYDCWRAVLCAGVIYGSADMGAAGCRQNNNNY